ncbi:glycerol-3-phosphate dehydrogenase/oxidase [Paenibacillus sp.]|uniref:glycerol-3-phosphate dehydrogenase/oxidase n=1 Tax=Paenibacillus sp. TaxID=58172 RepID=UPI002D4C20E7|nr:FAD-dependent oxidoreductase [Paenibacillus sp.]HZG57659.1 FAD-dependent oxidoreductase [Paenibacillus sp.]
MIERKALFEALESRTFDVLVIGGGITGAGIALDAATRGMKTALVEMQDFAAGTSSRSTKLVHGGLRYLKQLEVRMVAEVGRERAVVYENGPHVTTPEWMLLPMYRGGALGPFATSLGLRLYDYLADVKRTERRSMLRAAEALAREPLLRSDDLLGGGYYVEYRTDDARLTVEVLKKAADAGAVCLNYAKAEGLLYADDGTLRGARIVDVRTGASFEARARVVVNATGPWVDALRERDGSKRGKTVRLTKGVHLVFDGARFPLRQAVYFDTPDGRMAFAIPRDGKTYLGTTDTDYAGDPAHPAMSEADRTYLLAAANFMFPSLGLSADDVESSWAGLRPLVYQEGKSPSEVSRRDEIFESPSGLITIAGGKLTGYRKMAEGIVDRVAARLARLGAGAFGPCVTRTLPISGGDVGGSAGWPAYAAARAAEGEALGLPREAALRIARRYGSNAPDVLRYAASDVGRASAERDGLPLDVYATAMYAMEREQALRPADYWVRRTGDLYFDIARVRAYREGVLRLMARQLDYSPEERRSADEELDRLLREATTPVAEG